MATEVGLDRQVADPGDCRPEQCKPDRADEGGELAWTRGVVCTEEPAGVVQTAHDDGDLAGATAIAAAGTQVPVGEEGRGKRDQDHTEEHEEREDDKNRERDGWREIRLTFGQAPRTGHVEGD